MKQFLHIVLCILWAAGISACCLVDEDMRDCQADHKLDYQLQLVTNMTTELKTELETNLSTALDLEAAAKLKEHLSDIFTDYAHDVDLSFYDVTADSVRLHHESHIMDANQSSYTLYIPVRQYMHLALANQMFNGLTELENEELCHSAYQALLDKAIEDGELVSLPPVYLRETNKKLTGHVEYTINGVDGQTDFSMEDQGDFARNHTWTLYGYFLSGRNLQLTLSVQPWDLNNFTVDYNDSVVEASQLNLDTSTCEIVNVGDDKYNVYLKPGEPAKGTFYIRRPQSGKLLIQPVGDANAFEVTPDIWDIDHTNNDGRVDLIVRQNPDAQSAPAGSTITLSFTVEHAGREIDANTEILNGATYNFIL